jgi:hypothetical protein
VGYPVAAGTDTLLQAQSAPEPFHAMFAPTVLRWFTSAVLVPRAAARNTRPGARVLDDSSSSITVTPDGRILYGAYTRYDFAREHLMKFDSNGQFQGAYSFGWDSTPAIYQHGGTYSIVIKDNEYGGGPQFGSYCNVDSICPPRNNGPFFITQLDPNLNIEWTFQNTNDQRCTRNSDGSITCVPNGSGNQWQNIGFEWCINAPVVDKFGVVYANSEDGNLYAIAQGAKLKQNTFLDLALGAAYTPLAISPARSTPRTRERYSLSGSNPDCFRCLGPSGVICKENNGILFAVGKLPAERLARGGLTRCHPAGILAGTNWNSRLTPGAMETYTCD